MDQQLRASGPANVRAWPAANAGKVARLEAGDQVWAIGRVEVSGAAWYRVDRRGVDLGFGYGTLLDELPPGTPSLTSVATLTEADADTDGEVTRTPAEDRFSNMLDGLLED